MRRCNLLLRGAPFSSLSVGRLVSKQSRIKVFMPACSLLISPRPPPPPQPPQELVEAIVLPMTHKERFDKLGIRPPKVRRALA